MNTGLYVTVRDLATIEWIPAAAADAFSRVDNSADAAVPRAFQKIMLITRGTVSRVYIWTLLIKVSSKYRHGAPILPARLRFSPPPYSAVDDK